VEATRNATQQFIGEPANPAILNAMGTAIDTALKQLKASGALLDYGYQINATSQDQINGNLRVTLALVPALQIRKIILQVSLKPAASF
jgi:phage tail sheath protein FI